MIEEDLYRRLEVPPCVDAATLRRAFRRLALRFHPDRAGEGSTTIFQSIAAAYAVLSDPQLRSAYDRRRSGRDWVRPENARRSPPPPPRRVLVRLCGPLAELAAEGTVRVHPDGTIDLLLNPEEMREGGTAAVSICLPITCWVCGGLAERHGFDCELCGFDGSAMEVITIWVPLMPECGDGHIVEVAFDRLAPARKLKFRTRSL